MQRLFVAIPPPERVRNILKDAMGGIGGARWQTDAQLHLTLRFIGEADRHLAADIHAALRQIRSPSFEIALSGIGTFERRGRPAAVWAGVAPHAPLGTLHKKIDQALVRIGLKPEGRAYIPHITLARLNQTAGPIGDFLARAGTLTSAPFPVTDFMLFESELTPDGAVYLEVERYPLD